MKYKITVTYPQYGEDNGMDVSYYPSGGKENTAGTVLTQLREMEKTREPGIKTIEVIPDDK